MANVEFKDKYKMTPLMRAAQKGNVDMVNYLINTAGAKPHHKSSKGFTALSML